MASGAALPMTFTTGIQQTGRSTRFGFGENFRVTVSNRPWIAGVPYKRGSGAALQIITIVHALQGIHKGRGAVEPCIEELPIVPPAGRGVRPNGIAGLMSVIFSIFLGGQGQRVFGYVGLDGLRRTQRDSRMSRVVGSDRPTRTVRLGTISRSISSSPPSGSEHE